MYPLLICSAVVWIIIFERAWQYRKLQTQMKSFHLESVNAILRQDLERLKTLCQKSADLPISRLMWIAVQRLESKDPVLRNKWLEAVERARQLVNFELKRNLWILGTIGTSAPFIGLFGTVVGILRTFRDLAQSGAGGFAVVSSGISEALVATAAGIVVAVVAVVAFNGFQTFTGGLVLKIKVELEELLEILAEKFPTGMAHGP